MSDSPLTIREAFESRPQFREATIQLARGAGALALSAIVETVNNISVNGASPDLDGWWCIPFIYGSWAMISGQRKLANDYRNNLLEQTSPEQNTN